jgi:uncharacterized oligopeptide transporter (OPT) family protein
MKNREQLTPVAAAVTALSTLLCCVPTSFAAAIATTSVGVFVAQHQGWFLAASVVLIAIGVIQLRRAAVCSTGTKRWSAIVLAVSAGIVVAVIFFPQVLAGLMADWVMLGR